MAAVIEMKRGVIFRVLGLAALCLAAGLLAPMSGPAGAAALQSWRVVLVAGDDSAPVFDNAVDRLSEILTGKPGLEIRRLTSDRSLRTASRRIATAKSIDGALKGNAAQG
ncbi:MAG: hypothetical protein ACREEP_13375, partial [Dongiaceae bacterium]